MNCRDSINCRGLCVLALLRLDIVKSSICNFVPFGFTNVIILSLIQVNLIQDSLD